METCGQYSPTQTRTLHSTERMKEKTLDLEKDCLLTGLFNRDLLPYRPVGLPHFYYKTSSSLVWPLGGNGKFETFLFPQLLAGPRLPR